MDICRHLDCKGALMDNWVIEIQLFMIRRHTYRSAELSYMNPGWCDCTQNTVHFCFRPKNARYLTFLCLFPIAVFHQTWAVLHLMYTCCHILYCHKHSSMLFYLPMPIHCAVMPNALLSYTRPHFSTGQKGCFAVFLSMIMHRIHKSDKPQCKQLRGC